jgi:hypothetical protein
MRREGRRCKERMRRGDMMRREDRMVGEKEDM